MLPIQTIVSSVEGDTVVPDRSRYIDLVVEMPVAFRDVEFEDECFQWLFCSSIYRLTVSSEI